MTKLNPPQVKTSSVTYAKHTVKLSEEEVLEACRLYAKAPEDAEVEMELSGGDELGGFFEQVTVSWETKKETK